MPVSSPSTTYAGRSGPSTNSVQPRGAAIEPSGRAAVSSARTTVVPTATTRPPRTFVHATSSAVAAGTSYRSAAGGSWLSSDDTPVCNVIGAKSTPSATSLVTRPALNGRPALGISALPGSVAKTVWYDASGHRRFTYE